MAIFLSAIKGEDEVVGIAMQIVINIVTNGKYKSDLLFHSLKPPIFALQS